MSGVTIVGTDRYLPGDPILNDALARVMDTSDELRREGKIAEGDLICFLALGAGLNWGAALMRL